MYLHSNTVLICACLRVCWFTPTITANKGLKCRKIRGNSIQNSQKSSLLPSDADATLADKNKSKVETFYALPIMQIFNQCHIALGPPADQIHLHVVEMISLITRDLHLCMTSNWLDLKPSKTQLISLGSRKHLLNQLIASSFHNILFFSRVRDLCVALDYALTFAYHLS